MSAATKIQRTGVVLVLAGLLLALVALVSYLPAEANHVTDHPNECATGQLGCKVEFRDKNDPHPDEDGTKGNKVGDVYTCDFVNAQGETVIITVKVESVDEDNEVESFSFEDNQAGGPAVMHIKSGTNTFTVNNPVEGQTYSHPSGKAISNVAFCYNAQQATTTTTTSAPEETTTTSAPEETTTTSAPEETTTTSAPEETTTTSAAGETTTTSAAGETTTTSAEVGGTTIVGGETTTTSARVLGTTIVREDGGNGGNGGNGVAEDSVLGQRVGGQGQAALPFTGVDPSPFLTLSGFLMSSGGGLLLAARRRRYV